MGEIVMETLSTPFHIIQGPSYLSGASPSTLPPPLHDQHASADEIQKVVDEPVALRPRMQFSYELQL